MISVTSLPFLLPLIIRRRATAINTAWLNHRQRLTIAIVVATTTALVTHTFNAIAIATTIVTIAVTDTFIAAAESSPLPLYTLTVSHIASNNALPRLYPNTAFNHSPPFDHCHRHPPPILHAHHTIYYTVTSLLNLFTVGNWLSRFPVP
mmetsp:Transcript_16920/g.20105  ORF Transcript_16920/g.20105 Transcript_16920/m.20105 type:complete len:149 (+) Transcript_16920:761-1207(+)